MAQHANIPLNENSAILYFNTYETCQFILTNFYIKESPYTNRVDLFLLKQQLFELNGSLESRV